jgi:hypothetical protein
MIAASGLSMSMPLRDWLFIDAVMDNTRQSAIESFDDQVAARALAVREAGWAATGHITRPVSESGLWPPGDELLSEVVSVSLTPGDCRFIVESLLRGSDLAETVGYIDDAKWGRALAERVTERLEEGSVESVRRATTSRPTTPGRRREARTDCPNRAPPACLDGEHRTSRREIGRSGAWCSLGVGSSPAERRKPRPNSP